MRSPDWIARSCALLCIAVAAGGCSDSGSTESTGSPDARALEVPLSNPNGPIAAIDEFIAGQSIDKSSSRWKTGLTRPPQLAFGGETIYWDLETNVGNLAIRLMPDVAPMHASSTIYLTRLGFYDDVVFHRVIDGFMAQGGDPLGRGTGGPGYEYDGEFSPEARHTKRGLLSMANAGPGTDGSQFFITFGATPHLDDKHTLFGEVVDGMETLDALEQRGSRSGSTSEELKIVRATIRVE